MPKIKIKNIPKLNVERICDCHIHCPGCLLYDSKGSYSCMRDPRIEPKETIIELSEKDFPTNREWLEGLSNKDLAAFYTLGVQLKDGSYINLYRIVMSFTSSQQGIEEWLSQSCVYLMEE